ncbi:cytochrome P450 [Mucor mucedo]|uniref:cytochrome P450 n=1 Tax=Mucor mucedo TaxID=29922 RepID=UPI00221FA8B3|nr:cytochrome P450 [Mucor mucedo]KAI7889340.1 cytochrome P450 [Mucor mucedo]
MLVQEITRNLLIKRSSKTKYTYLGLLFSVYFILWLYRFLRVPPHLRHFRSVGYFKWMLACLRKKKPTQRLVFPKNVSTIHKFYLSRLPLTDWILFTLDPEAVKTILSKTSAFSLNTQTNPLSRLLVQNSLLSVNARKEQRKIMDPAIERIAPVQLLGSLVQKVFRVIEQETNQTVKIIDLMYRLTLDALGHTVFNFDFESLDKPKKIEWIQMYTDTSCSRLDWLLRHVPFKRRRFLKSVDRLNELFLSVTEKRRQEIHSKKYDPRPDNEKDLLTLVLESEIREEGCIQNEEIKCNLASVFVNGHETTSHALGCCLYYLAYDKIIQNKARQEVIRILGDEKKDVIPTVEDCNSMVYLDMLIKESLRRFGMPLFTSPHRMEQDTFIGKVLIPQGTSVSIDLHALHHDPQLWEEPYKFNPERFAPGGEYDQMEKENGYTFVPFCHGDGMDLSMTEQRVTLAMMLRKYLIELPVDSIHKGGVQIDMTPHTLLLQFDKRY